MRPMPCADLGNTNEEFLALAAALCTSEPSACVEFLRLANDREPAALSKLVELATSHEGIFGSNSAGGVEWHDRMLKHVSEWWVLAQLAKRGRLLAPAVANYAQGFPKPPHSTIGTGMCSSTAVPALPVIPSSGSLSSVAPGSFGSNTSQKMGQVSSSIFGSNTTACPAASSRSGHSSMHSISPSIFGSNTTSCSRSSHVTCQSQRAMSESSLQFSVVSDDLFVLVDSAVQTEEIVVQQATQTTQTEWLTNTMATQTELQLDLASPREPVDGSHSPLSNSSRTSLHSARSSGKPPALPVRERQMEPGGLPSRRKYTKQDSTISTRSSCSSNSEISTDTYSGVCFVETPALCRLKSLVITLRAWVLPKVDDFACCCPKHHAISLAAQAVAELEGCACEHHWSHFVGWQCRRCSCANIDVDDRICSYCGLKNAE